MSIDLNGATIAIVSAGFAPQVMSGALDRPTGPADILDYKFRLMPEETENRAISEISIFFF
jgi:hypothetical protein